MAGDEMLDIVDLHDQVRGQRPRSEIYHAGLCCFRVINIVPIKVPKNQIMNAAPSSGDGFACWPTMLFFDV